MREKARIKRICEKLQNIWAASPDQRLGQLIQNLSGRSQAPSDDVMGWPTPPNLWNIEDDEWEKLLDEKLSGKIEEYPCLCSGGNTCFIVRHPTSDVDVSFPTRKEAEKELERLNED